MTLSTLQKLIDHIQYKTWKLQVRANGRDNGEGWLIWWEWHDGLKSRKWYISPHMTPSEVVQTALKAVLTAEEHEAREAFMYQHRRLYGPHIAVEALVGICDDLDVRG